MQKYYKNSAITLLIGVIFITGALLSAGCKTTLHKDYRFKTMEQDLRWGTLHAKLRGKSSKISGRITVTGSPYELLIWFSTKDDERMKDCELILDEISLVNSKTGKSVLHLKNAKTLFRKESDGRYTASFIFRDIDLEYVEHSLLFTYHFSKGCSPFQSKSSVTLTFTRDYQEKKTSFWDALMGI